MRSSRLSKTASQQHSSLSRREFVRSAGMAAACAAVGLGGQRTVAQTATPSFDFYVSPTGTGTNAQGDLNNPWPISMLNDATARSRYSGKRIGFMNGTYNCASLAFKSSFGSNAVNIDGGSPGSPTVVQAINSRQAIIRGDTGTIGVNYVNWNAGGGGLLGTDNSVPHNGYITIDGFVFTGWNKTVVTIKQIGTTRAPGITIQNCEITGLDGHWEKNSTNNPTPSIGNPLGVNYFCMEIGSADGILIQNCYFHDNVGWCVGDTDHFHALGFWSSTNGTIQYCTFINSQGLQGKEAQNGYGSGGLVFRYNYVDSIINGQITAANGLLDFTTASNGVTRPTQIYNNIIHANRPLDLIPSQYAFPGTSAQNQPNFSQQIYNNTLLVAEDCLTHINEGGAIMAQAGGLSIYNNLWQWDAGLTGARALAFAGEGLGLCDYNLYPTNGGNPEWLSYHALRGWYEAMPFKSTNSWAVWQAYADAHSPTPSSSPLFILSGAKYGPGGSATYYQLQNASPARNSGSTTGRVGSSVCDIGAWGNGALRIGCDFSAGAAPEPPASVKVT